MLVYQLKEHMIKKEAFTVFAKTGHTIVRSSPLRALILKIFSLGPTIVGP